MLSTRISQRLVRSLNVYTRYNSTVATPIKKTSTGYSAEELKNNEFAQQAPNRTETWSPTQASRLDVIAQHPHRFVQRELETQPRPYAAIDLIAKEPVRYLSAHDGNVAVCDGNRGSTLQGHPKVFINLDQPRAATCGYCGLRYAKEEHRGIIEQEV
jgi:NADH dehydrogenase (ubiquinone) Fe-S protein 6